MAEEGLKRKLGIKFFIVKKSRYIVTPSSYVEQIKLELSNDIFEPKICIYFRFKAAQVHALEVQPGSI